MWEGHDKRDRFDENRKGKGMEVKFHRRGILSSELCQIWAVDLEKRMQRF